jgi:hypothetical protein
MYIDCYVNNFVFNKEEGSYRCNCIEYLYDLYPTNRAFSPWRGNRKHNELNKNHIQSQTMRDSFYHMYATLYLFIVWTMKSQNFHFLNKLRKIDVCL